MPKILAFSKVREEEGWVHELLVELDNGDQLCICDDTDYITVAASSSQVPLAQAVALWKDHHMGTSMFALELDPALQKPPFLHVRLGYTLAEMSGVAFSWWPQKPKS